ncbi:MAG: hypothetical protein R2873_35235, partial [Caldilineaceae bacterium]
MPTEAECNKPSARKLYRGERIVVERIKVEGGEWAWKAGLKDANNQLDQSRGFVELPNLAYLACDATLPNMQFEAIVR